MARQNRFYSNGDSDAYGHLVWDYYRTGQGSELVERNDGLLTVSRNGNKRYFSKYSQWPKDEQQAIRYARGKVLDIGCGAGRHALYLQAKGHEVLGIDNSPLSIRVCRLRGLKSAKVMPIEKISFPAGSFDTVLMMFNNFGLFGAPAKAKRLLRRLHRITKPGGVMIVSTRDPYKTRDPIHLAYQKANRRKGHWPGQLRIRIRHFQYVGSWFDYLLVSQKEMKFILRRTGWRIRQIIPGQNGSYHALLARMNIVK